MYYFDILEILQENQSEFLSCAEMMRLYRKKFEREPAEYNFSKALSKIRRREDIKFKVEGRMYLYKFTKKATK